MGLFPFTNLSSSIILIIISCMPTVLWHNTADHLKDIKKGITPSATKHTWSWWKFCQALIKALIKELKIWAYIYIFLIKMFPFQLISLCRSTSLLSHLFCKIRWVEKSCLWTFYYPSISSATSSRGHFNLMPKPPAPSDVEEQWLYFESLLDDWISHLHLQGRGQPRFRENSFLPLVSAVSFF